MLTDAQEDRAQAAVRALQLALGTKIESGQIILNFNQFRFVNYDTRGHHTMNAGRKTKGVDKAQEVSA